ncbi:MAG: citryl-CoA lyase [Gammaproteobacteria bacterium]|nr:citryl-CoA lyase [Gammaproteobacteria bacterium]MBU1442145.1 citryl-CoA lyase [Gammaproteobacteria bacterium]MBU2286064.1 citryl-CoA lyase [Gammaproteobacteria bacterium]MBU2407522.1 citryl-CoA lyase [Gammaproteobacteria bacterium]
MKNDSAPYTELCTHSLTSIHYRNDNLVDDILGQKTFTGVMFSQIMGREASADDLKVVDAALIAIMEHGLTPSAIATRLVYMSSPENIQSGVAAGLLAVGSQFVGTVENCAILLQQIIDAPEGVEAAAREVVQRYRRERKPIPGFGQHMHKPDDPRAAKLLEIGRAHPTFEGKYLRAIQVLSGEIDREFGKHITINATGAVGTLLGELAIPPALMRGFAVISRAAGLVAHIAEEQRVPTARHVWDLIDHAVPYRGEGEGHNKEKSGN